MMVLYTPISARAWCEHHTQACRRTSAPPYLGFLASHVSAPPPSPLYFEPSVPASVCRLVCLHACPPISLPPPTQRCPAPALGLILSSSDRVPRFFSRVSFSVPFFLSYLLYLARSLASAVNRVSVRLPRSRSRSFPPPIALHHLRSSCIVSAQLRHSLLASIAPSFDRATAFGLSCVDSLGFRADRFLRTLLPRRQFHLSRRFHFSRASGL